MPPKRKPLPPPEVPEAKKPAPDVPEDVKRFLDFVDKHVLLIAAPAQRARLYNRDSGKLATECPAFFVVERHLPLESEEVDALSDGEFFVEYTPKRDLVLLDLRPSSYHPLESGLFGKPPRVASEDKVVGAFETYDDWATLLPCPWKYLLKQAASGFNLGGWMWEKREHLKHRFSGFLCTRAYDYGFYSEVELFDASLLEELARDEDEDDEVDFGVPEPTEFDPDSLLSLKGLDVTSWKPIEEHNKKTSAVPLSQYLREAICDRAREDIEAAIVH